MSSEYIKMIEERLLEMREKEAKKLSPAQKKHLDKDDDGDIDSKDFEMLRKKKSESAEKMTPCPKCEGSMENHDPECPSHPDNKGGDSKEEVEQVDEANLRKMDHDEFMKYGDSNPKGRADAAWNAERKRRYKNSQGSMYRNMKKEVGKKSSSGKWTKADHGYLQKNRQKQEPEWHGNWGEEVEQVDENRLLKVNTLSSAEYQRAKKLKGFDKSKYTWDSKQQLYIKEEVKQVDEGKIDKSSPMYKEYQELKKMPIKQLQNKVALINRGDDVKGYDKEGAVSEILRAKYGKKKVDKVFGFSEGKDEVNVNGLSPEAAARKKARDAHMKGNVRWGDKDSKKVKQEDVDQIDEKLERDGPAKQSQANFDKKFGAHVRATLDDKGKTNAYLNKKRDQKDAQMKKNDPGQRKSMPNYTSNFVDKDKAVKKAGKRGLKPTPYDTMSGQKPNKMQKLQRGMKEEVVSEQWGFGEVIETTENGLNVYFEHGVEFNIPAEELTFVQESADRAKHYKGATKPETMLDKYKGAGAKKMATDNNVGSPKEAEITPEEEGHQDAVKAGKVTKQAPTRGGEPRKGDLKAKGLL